MVIAPDHLAAQAGLAVLDRGGSAVDAAIATSAVLAVTMPHMCGMGGDLWATVLGPPSTRPNPKPLVLAAAGRAGSGADPDKLLAQGHVDMPGSGSFCAVPVPGCVDGWVALHDRFGRLSMAEVLEAAIHYARSGFPASPTLADAIPGVAKLRGAEELSANPNLATGGLVRLGGVARTLSGIASGGRDAFYQGEFGRGLVDIGGGEYTPDDLKVSMADWCQPVSNTAWGVNIWSAPPPSQGYLTSSSAWMASQLHLPDDPSDPLWSHLLIEATRQAAYDRIEALWEGADPSALVDHSRLNSRLARIDPTRAATLPGTYLQGDTISCVVVGPDGDAVSLVQSNASGFGSGLVEPNTGIFLHNRGTGFSLSPGHPARYGPGRRPPSTLCPTIATHPSGELAAVVGTMGADRQPHILLQLLARVFHNGQSAAEAISAGRFGLDAPKSPPGTTPGGFRTWQAGGEVRVMVEGNSPPGWKGGLSALGHHVESTEAFEGQFGHAHLIVSRNGVLEGATDPRTRSGGVAAR